MARVHSTIRIGGVVGLCARHRVFLGFARARLLHSASFADVLDAESGRGYQRRINLQHSLDFRRYIQAPRSATIPLTFNARPERRDAWTVRGSAGGSELIIRAGCGPVLAQVDCQHRLGHLHDLDISLPFMCFLGLSAREEMEIFNVINAKAKGLSTSLIDFHAATLATDLGLERPELLVALHLHHDPESPWYRQLDIGGHSTSGLHRRASLRTMQKACKRFLLQTDLGKWKSVEAAARAVLAFWAAVAQVLPDAWNEPRKHLLTKGVGVYALMSIAADLVRESTNLDDCDRSYFTASLGDFLPQFDWTTEGPLRGLGGESGVSEAVRMLRSARRSSSVRAANHG